MLSFLSKFNRGHGGLFGCHQKLLRDAQQEVSPVNIAVLCMIYAPFVIVFVRCLRSSFRGFCYTLDIVLHLSMLPFKVILTLLHIPLNWCDAYHKWGGACPKPKRRCRPCGRSSQRKACCSVNTCKQYDCDSSLCNLRGQRIQCPMALDNAESESESDDGQWTGKSETPSDIWVKIKCFK